MNTIQRIILASASPRRQELLRQLMPHVEIIVRPSDVDESLVLGELSSDRVSRLAKEKCRAIQASLPEGDNETLIIGSDTEIVLGGIPLGKPSSGAEARSMLMQLSGTLHEALTGVCVTLGQSGRNESIRVVRTEVTFRCLTALEVDRYIATGEPLGKAGGYGIQGIGAAFVERINGSYSNVVGLPLETVYSMLFEMNIDSLAVK